MLLQKAGFIQQAYSGVFQLLPLGLLVQQRLERLIDKHMSLLDASKVSLSSLSTEGLWRRSGRLNNDSAELLKVRTRAKDAFILSPTHEEEVTKLVASSISSPKDLPLRLYQMTRKYRDERRPRQGLLRTREFVMKDLYTFDVDDVAARETYTAVKHAYTRLFKELGIPFIVAEADSGNMGGDLSHEFHLPSRAGEDRVFSCNQEACGYVANEELVSAYRPEQALPLSAPLKRWYGLLTDGKTLLVAYYRSTKDYRDGDDINIHSLKQIVPELNASVERPLERWMERLKSAVENAGDITRTEDTGDPNAFEILPVYDARTAFELSTEVPQLPFQPRLEQLTSDAHTLGNTAFSITTSPPLASELDLVRVQDGDTCPRCETGELKSTPAIELGHTFHLGTRYSGPLGATVNTPGTGVPSPVSMGCHGIGITRMIGAIAAVLQDERGLNWPRACAPFEVVIVAGPKISSDDMVEVYDTLCSAPNNNNNGATVAEDRVPSVIDDRDATFIQKLKDADLIGYPVIVALGREWDDRKVEVQCRRLGVKQAIELLDLNQFVRSLLGKL